MKIHEYQAKQIFVRYGIPIPSGEVASTPEEVEEITQRLGGPVVVKAQVHIGGRGKAGGIRLAETPQKAREIAEQILGKPLKGLVVHKVLVEKALPIQEEYYLGITLDRSARRDVVMISAMGGIDIEEVAETHPEAIAKVWIDPALGLCDFQIRELMYEGGIPQEIASLTTPFLKALYQCYTQIDASLAEINPLAVTSHREVIAADAKIILDDNALFRHPDLSEWREESEEDPLEAEAHQKGLQYVHLGGEIGIIGNGAGLVMATLDEVKRAGGNPANFLDIGGGARAELVANALEMVLKDPQVKGVLFNVFGGITRCDEVARGIIEATSGRKISVPIVVRLVGTNEAEGRALLQNTPLLSAETMEEAAEKIVALTRGNSLPNPF